MQTRQNRPSSSTTSVVKRHLLVDAKDGKPTNLEEEALVAAKKARTVIPQSTYSSRQLVNATDGLPTTLEGDELDAALIKGKVITRGNYCVRTYNLKKNGIEVLVNAETGKPTSWTGEMLREALESEKVITKSEYRQRKSASKQVNTPQPVATIPLVTTVDKFSFFRPLEGTEHLYSSYPEASSNTVEEVPAQKNKRKFDSEEETASAAKKALI